MDGRRVKKMRKQRRKRKEEGRRRKEEENGGEEGQQKEKSGKEEMATRWLRRGRRERPWQTWRRNVLMGVPPESAGGTQVRWREEERARSFR